MILVDTSVWIEVLRQGSKTRLEAVVDFDDVVTCLPVIQEVLQGIQDERAFALARDAMHALPIVDSPMPRAAYDRAADLYRAGRRAGLTIRSGVDCLIAACALRHDLDVLHADRDFEAIARVSPLRTQRLRRARR